MKRGLCVGLLSLFAATNDAWAQAPEVSAAELRREITRDGGRLFGLCLRAQALPEFREALRDHAAQEVFGWCATHGRAALPESDLLVPGVAGLHDEVLRRESLADVCRHLDALERWATQYRSSSARVPDGGSLTEADRNLQFAAQGIARLTVACGQPLEAARSATTLNRGSIALLGRIASVVVDPRRSASDQQREIGTMTASIEGGSAAEALTASAAPEPTVSFAAMALDGVAQFLQSRAQVELELSVVRRLRTQHCGVSADGTTASTVPPEAYFLASTCAFLGTPNSFFTPSFGPTFAAAVSDDALHLPERLGQHMDAHRRDFPFERGVVLRAGVALVSSLSSTSDVVASAIAVRGGVERWDCAADDSGCTNAKAILAFAAEATEAVARAVTGDRRESPGDDLARTLAATMQEIARQHNLTNVTIDPARVRAVLDRMEDVRARHRTLREATNDEARRAQIEPFATAVINLTNALLDVGDPTARGPRFPATVSSFFGALARRSVPDAVSQGLRLAVDLLREGERVTQLRSGRGNRGDSRGITIHTTHIPESVIRVLGFGADLASAQSAEQVSVAVTSFASPAGSWRAKSRNAFTFSLAGAFGIGAGGEWAHSAGRFEAVNGAPYGQLFAPVGLDLAFSVYNRANRPSVHLGLLLPVIDVGALAPMGGARSDARTFNETSFIAPGAYFRVGFAELPFIVGVGVSYHPFAHLVAPVMGGSSVVNDSITVSGFFAVDIPIFSFWEVAR